MIIALIRLIVTINTLNVLDFIRLSTWSTIGNKIVEKRKANINIVITEEMYGHIISKNTNAITVKIKR